MVQISHGRLSISSTAKYKPPLLTTGQASTCLNPVALVPQGARQMIVAVFVV